MRKPHFWIYIIGVSVVGLLAACSRGVQPLAPTLSPAAAAPHNVLERACDLYLTAGERAGETVRCGFVPVPWDRSQPTGAMADLAFIVLKATGDQPQPDAILHVAGGPGIGVTSRDAALELAIRYAPLRRSHDIIIYDQRGVGRSQPTFTCGYPDSDQATAVAAALQAQMGRAPTDSEVNGAFCEQDAAAQGFPTSEVSTATSAADLVDLMAALGYSGYNLYGISYGTRLLMALMHYYPDLPAVRSVVLDSPYPLPEDKVNDLAATAEAQFPALRAHMFDACAADAQCNADFPDLEGRYGRLVAALAAKPLPLPDGSLLTTEEFQRAVFPLWSPIGHVAFMPRLIAEVEAGDATSLLAMRNGALPGAAQVTALGVEHPRTRELIDAFLECQTTPQEGAAGTEYERRLVGLWDAPAGTIAAFLADTCTAGSGAAAAALVNELPPRVFNSIIIRFAPDPAAGVNAALNTKLLCTEQYPFAPALDDLAAQLRELELPAFFVREVVNKSIERRDGCTGWAGQLASPTPSTYGDYPVLILSGDYDTITPSAYARLAAEQLPGAIVVNVPTATHSILGNNGACVTAITQQFMADPDTAIATDCIKELRIPWSAPNDPLSGTSP